MFKRLSGKTKIFLLISVVCPVGLITFLVIRAMLVAWFEPPLVSTAGQLAFISDREGPRELYLINADGTHPTRLTYTPGDIWQPAWSPDGRYLAFVQGRVEAADIYLLDVEAALQRPGQVEPIRLVGEPGFDGYPVWSPDGRQLALVSNREETRELYLLTLEAGHPVAEPEFLAAGLIPLAWSPDGAHLAAATSDWSLVILAVAGAAPVEMSLEVDRFLAWSPDGRYLLSESRGDLYRVAADGSNLTRLTETPGGEGGAVWSPGGRQIAYIFHEPGSSDMGQPYLMNADGSGQRWLRGVAADRLTWSPDGTRLAFYSNRGRGWGINGEIWLMNADGSGLTVLTDHPAFDDWPAWRP